MVVQVAAAPLHIFAAMLRGNSHERLLRYRTENMKSRTTSKYLTWRRHPTTNAELLGQLKKNVLKWLIGEEKSRIRELSHVLGFPSQKCLVDLARLEELF